jgi:hypothetical protein
MINLGPSMNFRNLGSNGSSSVDIKMHPIKYLKICDATLWAQKFSFSYQKSPVLRNTQFLLR